MTVSALLETFDSPTPAQAETVPVTEMPGYAEGFSAAETAQRLRQETLRAELVEKFTEMSFGYVEAQKSILKALETFFETLASKVLPQIVTDIQHAQIVGALNACAELDASAPVTILISDEQIVALETALPNPLPLPIQIIASNRLAAGEVLLSHSNGETSLNAAVMVEAIQEILTNYKPPQSQDRTHG